jgi:hypothetical protein
MAAHSDSTQDAAPGTGMRGKTVLFTRAPRRMRCFAASEFARLGQRSQSSGTTRRGARQRSRRSAGPAELLHADTGDAAEVYALAAAVLARSGPDKETPQRTKAHQNQLICTFPSNTGSQPPTRIVGDPRAPP